MEFAIAEWVEAGLLLQGVVRSLTVGNGHPDVQRWMPDPPSRLHQVHQYSEIAITDVRRAGPAFPPEGSGGKPSALVGYLVV